MREEEATSRTEVVEEEQFLFTTNLAVVPLRGLGQKCFILGQLLFIGEGDTINALQ